MRTLSRALFATVALFAVAGVAHAGKTEWVGPATYENAGIVITVKQLFHDGKKLNFKLLVLNKTAKEVVVDRNQLTVKLADGTTLAREEPKGMFAGMAGPAVHQIPAGTSHDVNCEFLVPKDAATASLVLGGVLQEGKPIGAADFVVTPKK